MNKINKLKQFIICLCCIICSTICMIPYLSYATTQDDLDHANAELESLKAVQSDLASELSEIDEQLLSTGRHLAELDTAIMQKQSDIDDLNKKLSALSQTMDEQYSSMKLRIRYMYERSSSDVLDLLLSSKNFSELLLKSEYIYQLSQYDREMLDQMEDTYNEQQSAKQQLDLEAAELSSLREESLQEQENLKALLARTQEAFDISSNNVAEAEAAALAYEKKLEEEKIAREKEEAEEASRKAASLAASENNSGSGNIFSNIDKTTVSYDASDLAMLAAIIECEAGNQSYEGKLAVGSVVVNRVNSPRFANSISGVIYAAGQFTPVASGRFTIVLSRGASASCVQAAQEVLNGNVTINALYFHVYRSNIDTYGTVIGDHIFY